MKWKTEIYIIDTNYMYISKPFNFFAVIFVWRVMVPFLFLIFVFIMTAHAQTQNMGIGTLTPHPSAALDVDYTNKGVLVPRLTTAQRNAITSPATGLLIYNTDDSCFHYFNGALWRNLCESSNDTIPAECQSIGGTASVDTVCGDTVNLTLTGYNGTIQWQSSTENTFYNYFYDNLQGNTSSPVYTTFVDEPVLFFRAAVADSNCPVAYSNVIAVNRQCCCVTPDSWCERAPMPAVGKANAVAFSIGNKAYVGTGSAGGFSKDWWEYDAVLNLWTQKANFAGGKRLGAVGFSIGNKGYVGTGTNGTAQKDFWEYDQMNNTWTKKADFGGSPRYYATGINIGNKGYVGFGDNGPFFKDWWEYDPATDNWTQIPDYPASERCWASGFSIGSKGYVGIGVLPGVGYQTDFYEYNPSTGLWTQVANFPMVGGLNPGFTNAASFTIGSKGYVGTGYTPNGGTAVTSFYEYNPSTNVWTQKADFAGAAREHAVGFSIGNYGYIGTGAVGGSVTGDFWMYCP